MEWSDVGDGKTIAVEFKLRHDRLPAGESRDETR
jgi:hypothetical protein